MKNIKLDVQKNIFKNRSTDSESLCVEIKNYILNQNVRMTDNYGEEKFNPFFLEYRKLL